MISASGVAVSLELARIFASYKPKSTIVFTAFAGEEQGLLGAENLAQTYKNASVNIAGMINLDMVGKFVSPSLRKYPILIHHQLQSRRRHLRSLQYPPLLSRYSPH
jgi:Zn-dependent M28 family amino/carboxypeptidase